MSRTIVTHSRTHSAEWHTLLRTLQAKLKRIVAKRNQGAASTLIDAEEQEQIALAMFVSLYAVGVLFVTTCGY